MAEAEFDLEAVAIEDDDVEWVHGDVGGHQHEGASEWMVDEDEADQPPDGPPEQVHAAIRDRHIILAVDGTGDGLEGGAIEEQIAQAHTHPVEAWPSTAAAFGLSS